MGVLYHIGMDKITSNIDESKKISDSEKLRLGEKLGYCSAAIGDAIGYTLVTTFLMFYLTTVAGLQPAIAGTISVLGAVWNALINPIVGYLSDHARTKWGRRRPFMMGFCIPLMFVMIFLFTAVDIPYTLKIVYYGFMVIAFWASFTGFFVPFYALGAEYTQDYEERSTIRAYVSFFNMIGTLFSMAMPTMLVDFFEKQGMTTDRSWTIMAAMLGIITSVSIIITVIASKDKDHTKVFKSENAKPKEKLSIIEMFREYLQVLALKPMRWLLIVALFFLIAYAILLSDLVYLLTYNAGLSGMGVSMWMLIRCVLCMITIPIIAWLCRKTDKRKAMLIIFAFSAVGLITLRITGIADNVVLVIYIFVSSVATASYWQIMPAVFYDVCEYDEFETGKRREGAILAVQGLVEAAAYGVGSQVLGIILQLAGFDGSADIQSQNALEWVFNCATWVPVIFIAVAAFAMYKYPISREVYNDIVKKLKGRAHAE